MASLAVWLLTALATLPPAPRQAAPATCVLARAEARWSAYAYDHVVHLHNTCADAHRCVVATNVNPEPRTVIVPARTAVEVLTFRGSPARTFVPTVRCAPAGG